MTQAWETAPDSSGVMHMWHTPVRQLHRVGTSQASARSRRLLQLAAKGDEIPLRAKVTSGPVPGGPGGWCGAGTAWAASEASQGAPQPFTSP